MAPGPFWTPLQVSGGQPTEALPDFGAETPLGRAGQPAEPGLDVRVPGVRPLEPTRPAPRSA
nr:hypothetical protein [Angustibacter aerolatus]